MSAQTQTNTPARQAARNALFAAGLRAPQPNDYPTHAAYAVAFETYQVLTMAPLREQLAAA